ncbi:MAG TPA: hypothetical protein VHT73_15135 [Thermodesulfobacteriota bacterium]|nr:hypothetical protein [Thermodesulfobacteriota bacterium]
MARKVELILSHWHHLFDGMQESTQQFYSQLEKAVNKRQIPDIKLSRVTYREGGILTAKREYFRVRRREHLFDVCAAPFADSFFVSWWLGEAPGFFLSLVMIIPFLGPFLLRVFRTQTYFRMDTTLMFQELVHSAVIEVLEDMTKAKGIRALSELERKPIFTSLFSKLKGDGE